MGFTGNGSEYDDGAMDGNENKASRLMKRRNNQKHDDGSNNSGTTDDESAVSSTENGERVAFAKCNAKSFGSCSSSRRTFGDVGSSVGNIFQGKSWFASRKSMAERLTDALNAFLYNPRGGDLYYRFDEATRTALGSLFLFLLLVMGNKLFPSLWIGNKFMLTTIKKGSLGGNAMFTRNMSWSLLLVVLFAWPWNLLLRKLEGITFAFAYPIITLVLSFTILTCPWWEEGNLMLEFMYMNLQAGVRGQKGVGVFYPLALYCTSMIGCLVAVAMCLLPIPFPNLASLHAERKLLRVQEDFEVLLSGIRMFILNSGKDFDMTGTAISTIELATHRMSTDVKAVSSFLNSAKWELCTFLKEYNRDMLLNWVDLLDRQQKHGSMIRFAVNRRLLGEKASHYDVDLRDAQSTMGGELADCTDELVSALIEATRFCTSCVSVITPGKHKKMSHNREGAREIQTKVLNALNNTRDSMKDALDKAERALDQTCADEMDAPMFAFVIRRIELCQGIFSFSNEVASYLQDNFEETKCPRHEATTSDKWYRDAYTFLTQEWTVFTQGNYRIPLKAAFGMTIASLFFAIPALYEVAKPNASWPGVTVATVNLSTTGQSIAKVIDRARGTFIASAFSLMLSEFFTDDSSLESNQIKIPALTVFTFIVIYLKDDDHEYIYRYSCESIGSMLYGSASYNFQEDRYIPKRIALIFSGLLIFVFVELILFPRSSKAIVQARVLEFFPSVENFLQKAAVAVEALSRYGPSEEKFDHGDLPSMHGKELDTNIDIQPLSFGMADIEDQTERNAKVVQRYKKHAADGIRTLNYHLDNLKDVVHASETELSSAFAEPYFGLELRMSETMYHKLIETQLHCARHGELLVTIVQGLQQCFLNEISRDNPVRSMDWPSFYAKSAREAARHLKKCISKLEEAFPDGTLRAQEQNGEKALHATILFRKFEEVRLRNILHWSQKYSKFIKLRKEQDTNLFNGVDSLDLRVFLAVAESLVLDICQRLQEAGQIVEQISREFPRSPSSVRENLP